MLQRYDLLRRVLWALLPIYFLHFLLVFKGDFNIVNDLHMMNHDIFSKCSFEKIYI